MATAKSTDDKKSKVRTSVSLDRDDHAEVERIAERKRVSIAWVVRDAVQQYLEGKGPLFKKRR